MLAQGEHPNWLVEVQTELAENLPPVTADRVQLQHVIFNLITNAIDAMDLIVDRPRILRVKSELNSREGVIVTVEDLGSGIALENIDRIFDTFFTTSCHSGMGMGLAICRSIIESHVERCQRRRVTHGAVFRIVLPIGRSGGE